MRIKNLIAAAAITISSLALNAQTDSSFVEIGADVSPLFRSLFSGGNTITPAYSLYLEKSFGHIGLRAGAGISNSTTVELAGPTNGNTETTTTLNSNNFRLGVVLYKNFNPKWGIKYGVDGVISSTKSERNDTFINLSNKEVTTISSVTTSGVGAQAFLFTQYHFSKNISVGTELALRFQQVKMEDADKNSEFPEFDTITNTEYNYFNFILPTNLYLIVRF